jgi:hypothetical protein
VADDTFSLQPKNGVVADLDGNGVDDFKQGLNFNNISSAFDNYKPNAPVLGYDAEQGYTIRIGQVVLPVRFAYGGSGFYRQLFGVKVPAVNRSDGLSAGHYISPVQYNEATNQYVPYSPHYWYNPDNSPRVTPAATTEEAPEEVSFEKNCAGCHFTGIAVGQDANGEWVATAPPSVHYLANDPHYIDFDGDGTKEHVNTGCERCHGPGGDHVLSSGDPKKIVNPRRDFTAQQANELCGSCHSAGKSSPQGILDYPYDEVSQQPYAANLGAELFKRFLLDVPSLWPDGAESKQYHQQLQDLRRSSKWEAGVRCSECHDVHLDSRSQIRPLITVEDSAGNLITIPTKVEDNTQCLACHVGKDSFLTLTPEDLLDLEGNRELITSVVTQHTFHANTLEDDVGRGFPSIYTDGQLRCTECHMAKVATNAVAYDTTSHTFAVIPPERTLATQEQGGMPNSCAVRCHRPWAPIFGLPLDSEVTDWTEPSDVQLAEWLKLYFGPGGSWWQTELKQVRTSDKTSPLPRGSRVRSR